MRRKVLYYQAQEIEPKQIKKIKNIAKNRYPEPIYNKYFQEIETVSNLATLMHGVGVDEENLVLGNDWFLCYANSKWSSYVTFLEWVASKGFNGARNIEMMMVIRQILLDNKDKYFQASMRHDTSYRFFLKMVEDGFLYPLSKDRVYVDETCNDKEIESYINYLTCDYNNIEKYLHLYESYNKVENLNYVLHETWFEVTDKFVNKYNKNLSINNKTR